MRALAILAAVVACRSQPQRPIVATAVDPELLRTLAVLATSKTPSPTELAETRVRMDRGQLTMASYIDGLLSTKAFASDVAPLIILRQFLNQNAFGAPEGHVLQHTDGPRPVYYLHDPCPAGEAVVVHPWWS